jgi:hypothetical protein
MQDRLNGWCRVSFLDPAGATVAQVLLGGSGPPGISTVALVARLALEARRLGADVVIEEASEEMANLLWLAALPVEVKRQAEGRKQALGVEEVEEEAQRGDLAP